MIDSICGPVVGPVVGPTLGAGSGSLSIQSIFQAGDIGFWIDPSDMSSMFQDSAGTTPVTAVEQPVGRINDKSGRGAHLTQATAGARPILCSRINQHIKTDDLTDVAWTKTGCTITANGVGTLDKIVEDTSTGNHRVSGFSLTASNGMAFVQSFRLYPGERTRGQVTFSNTTPWTGSVAPVIDFSLTGNGVINSSTGATSEIAKLPDGSFRLKIAVVCAGAGNFVTRLSLHDGSSISYTGDGVSGFYAGEDDLRLGTLATWDRYQAVDTATVYDAAGFPLYLRFDAAGMWLGVTLGAAFTAGTIGWCTMTENTSGAVYGPNTVNITTNSGFGVADSAASMAVQCVSGTGSAFNTPNSAAIATVMPHVALATASGTTIRARVNLTTATSQGSVTNFNGATWRIGRTLNDGGVQTGRCYSAAVISRVLSATQEELLIRSLGRKAPNIVF